MEPPVGRFNRPARARHDKGRRSWSTREEEVLIGALKELIAEGWKSDNGFRMGYLISLENMMKRVFPNTDLKDTPHINSRITTWKRNYSSLFIMLSRIGIGLDPKSKIIEVTDKAWDAYIKVDTNARLMKHKSWPLYEHWCEIFGKDRATSAGAEDFGDAASHLIGATTDGTQDNDTNQSVDSVNEDEAEGTEAMSESHPESSIAEKTTSRTKRKTCAKVDPMCEIVSNFCQNTANRLCDIAQRIGYEPDLSNARRKIYAFVDKMEMLILRDKLRATHLVARSTEDLDIFLGLPQDAREEWIRMKLYGSV